MLQRWLHQMFKHRPAPDATSRRFLPKAEHLDDRIAPAVISSVPSPGQLRIVGDNAANSIVVSRTAGGVILVNGATVPVPGGVLSVAQTSFIFISGGGGNDSIILSSANGGLPKGLLHGDSGNDTLIGSFGQDQLFGDAGNDILQGRDNNDSLFGGTGNDTLTGGRGVDHAVGSSGADIMVWNDGDGSDVLDGGVDLDTVRINATANADSLTIGANGSRARVQKTGVATLSIDIGTSETVEINALGGADTLTVNDLTLSGVTAVNVNLGVDGAGDSAADAIVINGTALTDIIQAGSNGATVQVTGLAAQVNISQSEAANDRLTVNGLGGIDTISAGALAALIPLTLDGGDGNDTLNGGNGADTLIGGNGNDTIDGNQGNDTAFMGAGNDVFNWDPGDGSDIVEGQDGNDTLRFNGSAGAEIFAASSNGGRLLFTRNVGNIVMDTDDVETLSLNTLGSTDTVTVNDLSSTDVRFVNINLGVNGAGDAAVDAITVNGTVGADVMSISGSAGSVTLLAPLLTLSITNAEPANDSLTINTSAGNDIVGASGLANDSVHLTLNGGADNDILVGSNGADTINGDAGNDLIQAGNGNDTIDGGTGTDTIDGGAGTDTAINGETVTNVP